MKISIRKLKLYIKMYMKIYKEIYKGRSGVKYLILSIKNRYANKLKAIVKLSSIKKVRLTIRILLLVFIMIKLMVSISIINLQNKEKSYIYNIHIYTNGKESIYNPYTNAKESISNTHTNAKGTISNVYANTKGTISNTHANAKENTSNTQLLQAENIKNTSNNISNNTQQNRMLYNIRKMSIRTSNTEDTIRRMYTTKNNIKFNKTIDNMQQNSTSDNNTIDSVIEILLEKLELSKIDNETKKSNMVFSDILLDVIKGGDNGYFKIFVDEIANSINEQFSTCKNQIKTLLILSIFSAFIVNIQNAFSKLKTGDTVFYMIFLVVAGILLSEFIQITKIAEDTSIRIVEFMKILFPAYFLSVSFKYGVGISKAYYEVGILAMWLIVNVIVKIILKIASLHMFISFINELTDNMFSKMADIIKRIVEYSLKVIMVMVSSLNVIKSMSAPISLAKKNAAFNIIKMIPGTGNVATNISDTLAGGANALKNAIGISALIVIVTIILLPIIRISIYICMYLLITAISEPLADVRLLNIISKTAESGIMVLKCLVSVGIIFFITIAIVSISV